LTNIPDTALMLMVMGSVSRKGLSIEDNVMEVLPIPASVTFGVIPGFGDAFGLQGVVMTDDGMLGFEKDSTTASDTSFNFSTFPDMPSSVTMTNGDTDRPAISWSDSDTSSDKTEITMMYNMYFYTLDVPSTQNSIVFPELPDSLSAFRPNGWANPLVAVSNDATSYAAGYSDFLTKTDQAFGGVSLPASWNIISGAGIMGSLQPGEPQPLQPLKPALYKLLAPKLSAR
jgi:hypothetical protein